MKPPEIATVLEELQPLIGGRIQKLDRTGDRELVLSVRVPGRTLRLLISVDAQRVHLVHQRPPRTVAGGGLQQWLRQRLEGKPLTHLGIDGSVMSVEVVGVRLEVDLRRKKPFALVAPIAGSEVESAPVPTHFPENERHASEFDTIGPEEAENRLKKHLSSGILQNRKKRLRLEKNVLRDLERLEKMAAFAAHGELLKGALRQVRRGQTEVEVTDWTTQAPVRIALDPMLTPQANLQRLFKRAKKGTRGVPIVRERLRKVREEIASLDQQIAQIQAASGDALLALADRTQEAVRPQAAAKGAAAKRKPIDVWSRRYLATDGTEIRVGRGAKENDRLSLNGARGHDTWLHARGTAGAHVVLRVEKGRSPGSEALLDAAHLAAHHSSAKNDSKVEVMYTEARHVKKNKGDPPGRVSVAKGKTILVEMDPHRLKRLLEQ